MAEANHSYSSHGCYHSPEAELLGKNMGIALPKLAIPSALRRGAVDAVPAQHGTAKA